MVIRVASISSGKDSEATAIILRDRYPAEETRFVFADTDNEHRHVYGHLDYLRKALGRPIDVVHADFSAEIARKREYVLNVWPTKGVPSDVCERAASVLIPTGIAYLDLCLWKGRFPSTKAAFCTQELKRYPLDRYMMGLLAEGHEVESWQGVRRDESQQRKDALPRERSAEGWWIVRPIVDWSAQQVVDFCVSKGFRLNPLYSLGFRRVGCAMCINESKEGVNNWALQFPEVVDKIREWERLVGLASKRGKSSFFAAPEDGRADRQGRNIDEYVQWSATTRGGKQYDLMKSAPAAGCSSIYGLCE
jgi:3'-phosphoadenosine 5'-phosphosulfate sulfotransferase (PAPS reductase)/FAD synthetase